MTRDDRPSETDLDLALGEMYRRDLDPHVGAAGEALEAALAGRPRPGRLRLLAAAACCAAAAAGAQRLLTTDVPPPPTTLTAAPAAESPVVARSETWRHVDAGTFTLAGVGVRAVRRERTQVLAFNDDGLDVRITLPDNDLMLVSLSD